MQTALPVILAVTYPGSKNPFGPASGLSGFFDPSNRWAVLAPLTVAFATGLVNLVVLLPTAQKILAERKLQGL